MMKDWTKRQQIVNKMLDLALLMQDNIFDDEKLQLYEKQWNELKRQLDEKEEEKMLIVNTEIFPENGVVKSHQDCVGMIIETEQHGRVKLIEFKERSDWGGGQVHFYLDEYRYDTIIGSHKGFGNFPGRKIKKEFEFFQKTCNYL